MFLGRGATSIIGSVNLAGYPLESHEIRTGIGFPMTNENNNNNEWFVVTCFSKENLTEFRDQLADYIETSCQRKTKQSVLVLEK